MCSHEQPSSLIFRIIASSFSVHQTLFIQGRKGFRNDSFDLVQTYNMTDTSPSRVQVYSTVIIHENMTNRDFLTKLIRISSQALKILDLTLCELFLES
jgi:hypothetical protein